ncbi:MAG: hypothetical protein JSV30_02100 [Candidatus Omnitrophota bacterium]|nr:MAG: hypothetical protein JSV30_02100 [Candidatus Omnitrophota bacterium]
MAKVRLDKQLIAITENKVGMLAEVSSAVSATGINIQAICAYAMENEAHFMLVTDNNQNAKAALEAKGYKVKEEDAVLVELPNRIGVLQEMAEKLKGESINLEYIYGTTCSAKCDCLLIFTSDNNARAIEVLKKA